MTFGDYKFFWIIIIIIIISRRYSSLSFVAVFFRLAMITWRIKYSSLFQNLYISVLLPGTELCFGILPAPPPPPPHNFFGNLCIYIDTSLIFDSKIYTLSPLQNIYKLPHGTSQKKKKKIQLTFLFAQLPQE